MAFLKAPSGDLIIGENDDSDDIVEIKVVKQRRIAKKESVKPVSAKEEALKLRNQKKPQAEKKGFRGRKVLMTDAELKKFMDEQGIDDRHFQATSMLTMIKNNRALKSAGLDPITPSSSSRLTKLGDNSHVKFMVVTLNYQDLEILHNLIYLHDAVKSRIRRNILEFHGFAFDETSQKYKFREIILKRLGPSIVRRIAFIFGLTSINTTIPMKDLIDLIMNFLMRPTKMKDTPIKDFPNNFFQETPYTFKKADIFEGLPTDIYLDSPPSVSSNEVSFIKDVKNSPATIDVKNRSLNELSSDSSVEGIPIAEVYTSTPVNDAKESRKLSAESPSPAKKTRARASKKTIPAVEPKQAKEPAVTVATTVSEAFSLIPKYVTENAVRTSSMSEQSIVKNFKTYAQHSLSSANESGQPTVSILNISTQSVMSAVKLSEQSTMSSAKIGGQPSVTFIKMSGKPEVTAVKMDGQPTKRTIMVPRQPLMSQSLIKCQSATSPDKIKRTLITSSQQGTPVPVMPLSAPSTNSQVPQRFGPPIITLPPSLGTTSGMPFSPNSVLILRPAVPTVVNNASATCSTTEPGSQAIQYPPILFGSGSDQVGSGGPIILYKISPNQVFFPTATQQEKRQTSPAKQVSSPAPSLTSAVLLKPVIPASTNSVAPSLSKTSEQTVSTDSLTPIMSIAAKQTVSADSPTPKASAITKQTAPVVSLSSISNTAAMQGIPTVSLILNTPTKPTATTSSSTVLNAISKPQVPKVTLKPTVQKIMALSKPSVTKIIMTPSMPSTSKNLKPAITSKPAQTPVSKPMRRAMKTFTSAGRNGNPVFKALGASNERQPIAKPPEEITLSDSDDLVNSSEDDKKIEEDEEITEINDTPSEAQLFSSIRDIIHSSNLEDITLKIISQKLQDLFPNLVLHDHQEFIKDSIKKVISGMTSADFS